MPKSEMILAASWFMFLFLIIAHSVFLFSIVPSLSYLTSYASIIIAISFTLFLSLGYYVVHRNSDPKFRHKVSNHSLQRHLPNNLLLILISISGALLTHFVIAKIALPSILLASGIAFIAGSFLQLIRHELFKSSDFAFYAGVFVGCTTLHWSYNSIWPLICSGLITGSLFVLSKDIFIGLGGRLGTFAFISVWLVDYYLSLL